MKDKDFKELLKSIEQARAINKTIKEHRTKKYKIMRKTVNRKDFQGKNKKETDYYFITMDKNGQKYAIDADGLK